MGITSEKAEGHRDIIFNERFEARFCVQELSQMVDVAGRCTRCWGAIIGRKHGDCWIHIECRVCRRRIDAEEAAQEFERMEREMKCNLLQVCKGRGAVYDGNARFVLKILPEMGSDTKAFEERIANAEEKKRGHLTRRDFPCKGSPGYLYFQACILVSGLDTLPHDMSPITLSDFDLENVVGEFGEQRMDESGEIRYSTQLQSESLNTNRVQERMGTAMMAGFTAAFACEIMMKALLITRIDKARKSHDLLELYGLLPEDCRDRLKADFAEIGDILKKNRHVFGKWRYFEQATGREVLRTFVDRERVWGLGKAARVLVDEGLIAGLQYDFRLSNNIEGHWSVWVSEEGQISSAPDSAGVQERVRPEVVGHETAIPWDTIMQQ